jgi:membrane protease subunit (stomatin/prohibitin family)
MSDYTKATGWRRLRPHNAFDAPKCRLCGAPAQDCADCNLPAEGDVPAGEAWFVPICAKCYEAAQPKESNA